MAGPDPRRPGQLILREFVFLEPRPGGPDRVRCKRCRRVWTLGDEASTAQAFREMVNHHKRPTRGKMAASGWRA